MSQARQGDSEIEVTQREKVLQPHRYESLFGGFFIAALAQPNYTQAQMRLRAVAIDLKRTLECSIGIVDAPLA